ncbi:arsenic resistance protein [Bacillus cytotoxicus]|uniref:arsenic resistance protein n=1 Tax=Bacillus cereus group sp. BfR-BA-01492 TaxID=2920361 RepID=UPI001F55F78B|nr:arsenic resistance protein [Bacillus cereus group sp. BfR-BA-01492]EMA6343479.1 arsenic resistance protein [Bacillus cytotoxicus]
MITREKFEEKQVSLYFIVLIVAALFGFIWPNHGERLELIISFIIALLMYSMFSQIPFMSLKNAFGNSRFISALLTTNFIVVPIVVWILSRLLPDNPPLLLGFYLVLLTPCIDYVIVFTSLGKGNEKLILISTPILFIVQMLLLPLYLWIFMGGETAKIVEPDPFIEAFLGLIILPLGIAILIQIISRKTSMGNKVLNISAWLPVPFMALTLFVVVASQIGKLPDFINQVIQVVPIYIAFMVIMPIIAKYIAKLFKLDVSSGRTLIFSSFTRNSLVVLPLGLALPDISTLVAAIIVTQTIVELISELIYIRVVPNVLLQDKTINYEKTSV